MSDSQPTSLVRWSAHISPGTPLLCFPWAGAGASVFRDWPALLPASVEVWAARLPARESRIREAPVVDIQRLCREFADAVESKLNRDVALLGHCSGALLAYELAVELRRRRQLRVSHLFVVTQKAPSITFARERCRDVRAGLRAMAFTDERLFDNDEMIELLRPAIEADFEMVARYRRGDEPPLDIPITAFVSKHDTLLNRDAVRAWAQETQIGFHFVELEGDHLFTGRNRRTLAAEVGATLLGQGRSQSPLPAD